MNAHLNHVEYKPLKGCGKSYCIFFPGFAQAVEFAKEYSRVKGPGTKAKPEQHAFFRRLAPIVKRTLEKCERENGLM